MLKVENVVFPSSEQLEAVIRGMRNPMNSWDKSDSELKLMNEDDYELGEQPIYEYFVGNNDLNLMNRLFKGGTEHRKYLRMIPVYMDITAPLYWWKEFDTYKIGTVANSCSTMHKIQAKEFTILDFSEDKLLLSIPKESEHVFDEDGNDITMAPNTLLGHVINHLNAYRKLFLETKDKTYWWQMIQLLPSSYNQKRTVMINYEVCARIIDQRSNHKLDEWHTLIDELKLLPYMNAIMKFDD